MQMRNQARCRPASLLRVLLLLSLLLLTPRRVFAYSVQSHQQLVDLSWKSGMEPLLLARYPGLNAAQLREAHAYAYGGCATPRFGVLSFWR